MLTATLNDGLVVLAKLYNGRPAALTFANRTQAERAAAKVPGARVHKGMARPFYVCPPEEPTPTQDRSQS